MSNFKIIFLFLLTTVLYGEKLEIDDKKNFTDLLPSARIYIDYNRSFTIKDIVQKEKDFKENDKKLLGYGYNPNFNVWIQFTLQNTTDEPLTKILEYDNSLTTHVVFFDTKTNQKVEEGVFNILPDRKTLSPIFTINLEANESRTFYIKASSQITTLIIKLNLWNQDAFYESEIKHQFILALFFGSMFILGIYNLFIYFFTKDLSYLYYVLYITGIIVHHAFYTGISYIYFPWSVNLINYAVFIVAFPIYALALFTRSFLQTYQYPLLHKIFNSYLILFPLLLSIFLVTDEFSKFRNLFTFILLISLVLITIYSSIKKNRQSHFILFGWFIILLAGTFMFTSSTGIFNVYKYYPYIVETSFVLEAIIFSIALADRINILQRDKAIADEKLISLKEIEKKKLEILVSERTKELELALDEKSLLLRELNHRVKNNMQTIVSLIRLQSDEIDDAKTQNIFLTVQNRINAMSHLHQLLYQEQDNVSYINAHDYFNTLANELKESYDSNAHIFFTIKTNIRMEQAIYCGLILNELITNSIKYAFDGDTGKIGVTLRKDENFYKLSVTDNGKGYDKKAPKNSLGLTLVDTLVKGQLKGNIEIDSTKGVTVDITWRDHE